MSGRTSAAQNSADRSSRGSFSIVRVRRNAGGGECSGRAVAFHAGRPRFRIGDTRSMVSGTGRDELVHIHVVNIGFVLGASSGQKLLACTVAFVQPPFGRIGVGTFGASPAPWSRLSLPLASISSDLLGGQGASCRRFEAFGHELRNANGVVLELEDQVGLQLNHVALPSRCPDRRIDQFYSLATMRASPRRSSRFSWYIDFIATR